MGRVISAAFTGFRILLPFIIRGAVHVIRLMLTSMLSLWVGVPIACERVAEEWRIRAVRAGLPSTYSHQLYHVTYFVALVAIIAGWIALAFVTVTCLTFIF